uniref:Uncharacterized protein n=1 Tax=Vitis vinifera TaxID=29760 RepID=F6GT61_VITVI
MVKKSSWQLQLPIPLRQFGNRKELRLCSDKSGSSLVLCNGFVLGVKPPDILTTDSWISPNTITRTRANGKASSEGMSLNMSTPSSSLKFENHSVLKIIQYYLPVITAVWKES